VQTRSKTHIIRNHSLVSDETTSYVLCMETDYIIFIFTDAYVKFFSHNLVCLGFEKFLCTALHSYMPV
jgi:hypothetical protein